VVPGEVRMCAHPPVRTGPESRLRRESQRRRFAVEPEQPLADEGSSTEAGVEVDRDPAAAPRLV
jgi:hypothetical protein